MQLGEQDIKQVELQSRADADLSKRARGGIVIYLLAWLVVTLPSSIHVIHPQFFYLNTGIMFGIALARIAHIGTDYFHAVLSRSVRRRWLVWSVLAGALHWGLLVAWVVTYADYASIEFQMIASAAVFGIAGTASLSIAREIRFLYSPVILGPLFFALVVRGSADDWTLAAMSILAVAYVAVTAKTTSQDYWQAIGNEQLAEQRAMHMEKLSHTDQLTQLNNRAFFDRRFSEEWKRGNRLNSQLSILMIDLDHFKALNDEFGHLFGDHCLQRVAEELREATPRETDILARYGGEEFVVLLPDSDAAGAALVAERLRAAVASCAVSTADESVALSCSIGGATMYPIQNLDPEYLLEQADTSLYQAKAAGRNCYVAAETDPLIALQAGR